MKERSIFAQKYKVTRFCMETGESFSCEFSEFNWPLIRIIKTAVELGLVKHEDHATITIFGADKFRIEKVEE